MKVLMTRNNIPYAILATPVHKNIKLNKNINTNSKQLNIIMVSSYFAYINSSDYISYLHCSQKLFYSIWLIALDLYKTFELKKS